MQTTELISSQDKELCERKSFIDVRKLYDLFNTTKFRSG